ncbi:MULTISPECIES: ABC transporter permease [Paenibacillus]|uniref:ABC transporter permease n=1 Tax=Paenibacillus TaxID=44249 RepID=UPI0006FD9CE4|nr:MULTISPECIES: ABC transporter permease [Paenibacillus]KRE69578.1 sugar ABC transporter permease [Paenibacillus sp. Soil750]NQX60108.1 ABC transporter permease [Paenibacillus qinlingensis]
MKPFNTLYENLAQKKLLWPSVGIILILIFNAFFTPGFFNIRMQDGHLFGSLIDILNRGTPILIIALGMTLVIAMEGIDISVGSVLAISASLAAFLMQKHVPFVFALGAGLAIGALCGFWNGILVAKLKIQPMIATLILLTVGRGIAQLISGGQIITISNKAYRFVGGGYLLGIPFSVVIAAFVFLALYFITRKTAFGLFLESVGSNRVSSEFTGIHASRIMLTVYIICGFCAGLAGIIVSSNITGADSNNAGLWFELDAILAVVIGGTSMRGGRFYLGGTVLGALFIQTMTTTIYTLGVPSESVMVVKAVVIILVSLVQSEVLTLKLNSLFHRKSEKKVLVNETTI